ncbi:hypothetical protein CWI37_1792p0010 [Hamiltosporidium tvaerminnensis]|uniref:Uncharacterized protein n=1 Tax=Hamiltosporidium tvaerminnensis TaxID=1176355 RepID=A0A4Q9KU55_9MICR|nr:hypothetical protein CWI37_1792p0010 [Hamiltosporidium tvaerminnensis]
MHIFPFYSSYTGEININESDLDSNEKVIRGILCKKKKFDNCIPVYRNGKEVYESIYIWYPVDEIKSGFEEKVNLIKCLKGNKSEMIISKNKNIKKYFKSNK